jgi:hypothetical protein
MPRTGIPAIVSSTSPYLRISPQAASTLVALAVSASTADFSLLLHAPFWSFAPIIRLRQSNLANLSDRRHTWSLRLFDKLAPITGVGSRNRTQGCWRSRRSSRDANGAHRCSCCSGVPKFPRWNARLQTNRNREPALLGHLLLYRIIPEGVQIIRVLHGARNIDISLFTQGLE